MKRPKLTATIVLLCLLWVATIWAKKEHATHVQSKADAYEQYKRNAGTDRHYIYSSFSAVGKQKLNKFFTATGITDKIKGFL